MTFTESLCTSLDPSGWSLLLYHSDCPSLLPSYRRNLHQLSPPGGQVWGPSGGFQEHFRFQIRKDVDSELNPLPPHGEQWCLLAGGAWGWRTECLEQESGHSGRRSAGVRPGRMLVGQGRVSSALDADVRRVSSISGTSRFPVVCQRTWFTEINI